MGVRFLRTCLLLIATAILAFASPAFAFDETTSTAGDWATCMECHYPGAMGNTGTRWGPHGGYATTTNACKTCHTLHDAPSGFKLLPGETIHATCMTCHDGTATIGEGVYGAISGRGLAVASGHRIETTSAVPGGNAADGGSATISFAGPGGKLTCSDCHSPHGNDCVNPFLGERQRAYRWGIMTLQTQNRLLKRSPTGATTSTASYGSDWCLACHKGRGPGLSEAHNHPAESKWTTATPFIYNNVARLNAGVNATATTLGPLAANNGGYLMPYPRTAEQTGHAPICQQCHEDARDVGSLSATGNAGTVKPYMVGIADGRSLTDNPRFQNFPHESTNYRMLVEATSTAFYDDLCLNCHPVQQLP